MNESNIVIMPTSLESHPPEEALELYALDRLPEEEQIAIDEHLLICEECRRRLSDTDEYVAAMQQALREVGEVGSEAADRPGFWSRLPQWLGAVPKPVWAGALAAALVMAVIIPMQQSVVEPADISLTAYRGEPAAATPTVPARSELTLRLDLTGLRELETYRVEVADGAGSVVFSETVAGEMDPLVLPLDRGLRSGQYWVRLYDPGEGARPLREFSLRVK